MRVEINSCHSNLLRYRPRSYHNLFIIQISNSAKMSAFLVSALKVVVASLQRNHSYIIDWNQLQLVGSIVN